MSVEEMIRKCWRRLTGNERTSSDGSRRAGRESGSEQKASDEYDGSTLCHC